MNDARARIPDRLARWRFRARAQRAGVVLAAALPLVAAASWLALRAAPGAFAATAATTLAAALALAAAHARRADLAHVARRADTEQAALEDSAALAFADEGALNPLQRLQRARVRERLAQVPPPAREPVPWRALAFAWLAALALVALDLVPERATAPRGRDDAASPEGARVPPTTIARATLAIEPPAYTGLPPRTTRELDARVEAGAVVRWAIEIAPRPDAVSLRFHDGETLALAADGDAWRGERRIDKSTLYRVVAEGVAPPADARNHRLDAIPDRAPAIRVVAPERTLTPLEAGQSQWSLSFEASDDYGIAGAQLAVTNAKGAGENIEVSTSTLALRGEGEPRARRYRHAVALGPYAMAPGDDLIVKLTVRDNRAPSPQSAQSASYILRAPFEPAGESTGVEGLVRDTLPAYFRSQRQIIIDTEALLGEAPKLAHDTMVQRSDAIGVDQRILRMRYGQFLGEESSEVDEAEHEGAGHEEGARPGATSREILEAFGHTHDDAEAATLLDPETKKLLREALAAMWDAEGQLRSGVPRAALPHEYRALEKIKQVQQATRIYLARVGLELPQLDEARRLTGDRAGLRDRVAPLEPATTEDAVVTAAWHALARRERPDIAALKAWAARHEAALDDPLAWFDVLERWEADPACAGCADNAAKLVWLALPPAVPAARPRVAADAAARAYLERIQGPAE